MSESRSAPTRRSVRAVPARSSPSGNGRTANGVDMPDEPVESGPQGLSAIALEVYKDLARPAVRRVGLSLETLIKVALSPIDLVDWGFEQSREWLRAQIAERLSQTPPEYVNMPTANIVHSALHHVALSHDTPALRELYSELLLKAMDTRTANCVHPAYFQLIAQLAPEEALVLVGLHVLGREDLFREESTEHGYVSRSVQASVEKQFGEFCASLLTCTSVSQTSG